MKLLIALVVAAICLAVSCKKENTSTVPACIQAAIDSSVANNEAVFQKVIWKDPRN